jgi:TonB family protein
MQTLPLASAESFLLTYAFNALWQIPLIFAAAWLAARASRRAGPAFHHALWTAALFAEILLPAVSARPFQTALQWLASWRNPNVPQTATITITMTAPHPAPGFHLPPALLTAALVLYLAAFVFFAARLAIGLHQTVSLRRRAQPLALTGHALQSVHRYAQLFAVRNAHIAASAEIAIPITLGIRRPTLLLPAHLDTTLLPEDLDAILAHEFAHMRRRDFAKNLLYQLLSLPIAFHPVLWLTRSRMSETRELLCDALAANAVAGRQRYARSLLRLATQFAASPHATSTPQAIGIFDTHPFKNFERRIMNLTQSSIELRGAARFAPAALSLLLIGGASTAALAYRQQIAAPQTQTTTAPSDAKIIPDQANTTPGNVDIATAPAGVGPSAIVIGVPHSANAQPKSSFKVDIPDPVGPNSVVKVLTPTTVQTTQTTTQTNTQTNAVTAVQIRASDMAGNRDKFVEPVYPPDAKTARIQGSVVLDAVIGKDGMIENLKVVSGPPELTRSAVDAVRQWTYKPYLLNGDPVAVETTITVTYALASSAATPAPQSMNSSAPSAQIATAPGQPTHIGGDVQRPILIHQAEPEYSQQAKAAKFSGTVRLSLVVEANGRPTHVRVVKGVGMGLDEKAVEAVRQYQFKPATLAGKPVPVDLYVDVNFQML